MSGDIIYALPAIRALGGGELRIQTHWMPQWRVAPLLPLLRAQPYLSNCRYTNDPADVELDGWRRRRYTGLTIADAVLRTVNCPTAERNRPWLQVAEPLAVARVLFHRSPRYQNLRFPWKEIWQEYGDVAAMVGNEDEHRVFCSEIGPVPHVATCNLLQLAQVIAGCELFVGNQSAPFAIAEALKKPVVLEVCAAHSDCVFERPHAFHGIDETIRLPQITALSSVQIPTCAIPTDPILCPSVVESTYA